MTRRQALIIGGGCALFAVALAVFPLLAFDRWDARGTYGDMFGGSNAFFSGVALLLLVYTVLQQSAELRLQRQELAMTREELSRSASAQEETSAAMMSEVEEMRKAARLNALSTLVQVQSARWVHLRQLHQQGGDPDAEQDANEARENYEHFSKQLIREFGVAEEIRVNVGTDPAPE